MPIHPALTLPAQPAMFAALQALQSIILSECFVGGASPYAALSSVDAARYGVANAVFIGRPKDVKDVYLPQCCLWVPPETEAIELAGYAGHACAEFTALILVYVDWTCAQTGTPPSSKS